MVLSLAFLSLLALISGPEHISFTGSDSRAMVCFVHWLWFQGQGGFLWRAFYLMEMTRLRALIGLVPSVTWWFTTITNSSTRVPNTLFMIHMISVDTMQEHSYALNKVTKILKRESNKRNIDRTGRNQMISSCR